MAIKGPKVKVKLAANTSLIGMITILAYYKARAEANKQSSEQVLKDLKKILHVPKAIHALFENTVKELGW